MLAKRYYWRNSDRVRRVGYVARGEFVKYFGETFVVTGYDEGRNAVWIARDATLHTVKPEAIGCFWSDGSFGGLAKGGV